MSFDKITLAHGAGGSISQKLMQEVIRPALGNPILDQGHDGARLEVSGHIAFTTDSYVVNPRFFPGGSIGRLALCGTVNDLAMSGAEPRGISLGLILEEGLDIAELQRILRDVRQAADEAGVSIVTGDTKVVGQGAVDGIFINTAGIGDLIPGTDIRPERIVPGLDIIVSGLIGNHAAAVMAHRHGLEVPDSLVSDCAPLNGLVAAMLAAVPELACLRDPTRGGVAATLNELAGQAGVGMLLDETKLPISEEVQAVCDILGFDALELANEGKLVAFCPPAQTAQLLAVMHEHEYGRQAAVIGQTTAQAKGRVGLKTPLGAVRVVDMPLGSLVPRIC
jgi:hydrogenase expression/formation protein HypE